MVATFGAILIWFVLAILRRFENRGERPESGEIVPSSQPRNYSAASPRKREY